MKNFISLLMGVLIFVIIPLIGWGINDCQAYFLNTYRMIYSIMMFVLLILVVIFVPNQGKGVGEGEKVIKRQKLAIIYLQIVPTIILLISSYFDRREYITMPDLEFIRISGLIFAFTGYVLMSWSVLALHKYFSIDVTIQKDHKLITSGLYRYIRHPRYIGVILFFTGVAVLYRSYISLGLAFLTLLVLLWRIRDEEKLLESEFGSEWIEYKKKSYSLIPFIY